MAIIDANGLFGGNRWRGCSNPAQLHWPRLFLASDGFGRLELNYHKIIARAYATFNPIPSEMELQGYLQEYARNSLLFVYGSNGQVWGQWDTPDKFLPQYKTAIDRRSPIPPEPQFTEWKKLYRSQNDGFAKCFENVPNSFLYGKGLVGYGVGKESVENTCASLDGDTRVSDCTPLLLMEPDSIVPHVPNMPVKPVGGLTPQQETWFNEWWPAYWLHKAKKAAREAFRKHVKTAARFHQVMESMQAQSAEMLTREPHHRPHGATWLNGERWADEITPAGAVNRGSIGSAIEQAMQILKSEGDD